MIRRRGSITYRHDGASFLDGIDGSIDVDETRSRYEQAIADALAAEFPSFRISVGPECSFDDGVTVEGVDDDDDDDDDISERASEVVRAVYEAADWIVYEDEEAAG